MNLFKQLLSRVRLARWRSKLKANNDFSLHVSNPAVFLRRLGRENVPYVVLNGYLGAAHVLSSKRAGSISLLVQHGSLSRIAAAMPFFNLGGEKNKTRVVLYSDSGRNGLAHRQLPYYPPVRARHLLDNRTFDPRGWYRIAPTDYLPALVYHLTYHLRLDSGIPMLPGHNDVESQPARTNCLLLQEEANHEGVALPPLKSLLECHQWLLDQAWAIPFDLIQRWPGQDAWLVHLHTFESARLKAFAPEAPSDLVVLVTRQETREHQHEQHIVETLARHGTVLQRSALNPDQARRLLWWARGGNWLAAKHYTLSAPDTLITCQLPPGAAAAIKAELRKGLARQHGKQNWLHSTDDLAEALYYQHLISRDDYRTPFLTAGQ